MTLFPYQKVRQKRGNYARMVKLWLQSLATLWLQQHYGYLTMRP